MHFGVESASVKFARGAELVSSGEVAASVVIFSPASTDSSAALTVNALTDAVIVPLNVDLSADTFKLYELDAVDISTLPVGTYQLGLILTKPEGNPLVINDWYRGLLGLVDIVGLTITDKAVEFDQDGDGLVDDDADGDGFSDESDDDTSSATTSS